MVMGCVTGVMGSHPLIWVAQPTLYVVQPTGKVGKTPLAMVLTYWNHNF